MCLTLGSLVPRLEYKPAFKRPFSTPLQDGDFVRLKTSISNRTLTRKKEGADLGPKLLLRLVEADSFSLAHQSPF